MKKFTTGDWNDFVKEGELVSCIEVADSLLERMKLLEDNVHRDTWLMANIVDAFASVPQSNVRRRQYTHYLASQEWKAKRFWILFFYQSRCVLCGEVRDDLHIHHNTYERVGHERFYDLVPLCPSCHQGHHGRYSRANVYISKLAGPDGEAEADRIAAKMGLKTY